MRGALIHGILLAVMLVYGYRTWTRDKTVQPNVGNIVLWNKSEADIVSIQFTSPKKTVKLEKKPGGYWWGAETSIETKAKPAAPKPADAGSAAGSGSAGSAAAGSAAGSGSGAGSGSAAKEPEIVTIEEEEIGQKTKEFPVGEGAEKLIKQYAAARALRDLGKPNEAAKKDYKLGTKPALSVTMKDGKTVSTSIITITFKDGSRSFAVGGAVYGGSDKYVMDEQSGKAYVFSKDLLSGLEIGQSSLQLLDPRGFDASTIGSVTIEANGKTKTVERITTKGGPDGSQQVKTWADAATKKADQTAANFVDNANNLRPTEYASSLKVDELALVMKLTYKDERGGMLGTMTLYKREKPGQLAEGQELDPANPPKGDTEYYIMTEKTRVPALVRKDQGQRSEQDIETVFSGKPAEPKSVDPHGNPFGGNAPAPGAPVNPHGAPAPGAPDPHGDAPHAGSAAGGAAPTKPATPAGAGSAAPAATKPAAPAATKPAVPAATKPAAPAAGSAAAPAH